MQPRPSAETSRFCPSVRLFILSSERGTSFSVAARASGATILGTIDG